MGTTPILGLPYVEPTDALAAYPAADHAQALAVENATPPWGEFRLTADQSVATAASVVVNLTKFAGTADLTVAGGEITIGTAGIYAVSGQITYLNAATAVGVRFAYIMVNAATVQRNSSPPSTSTAVSLPLGKVLQLAAGAKIRLNAYHTQGAALSIDSTNMGTYLTLARL